jgi:hypothetical protein
MFETLTNRTDGGALRCLGGGHARARGGEERGNSARYDIDLVVPGVLAPGRQAARHRAGWMKKQP